MGGVEETKIETFPFSRVRASPPTDSVDNLLEWIFAHKFNGDWLTKDVFQEKYREKSLTNISEKHWGVLEFEAAKFRVRLSTHVSSISTSMMKY
mmetsp:Transcript_6890/g.11096  ORF Transcript_6890/g.11096 Transcript_6890/m.11096 type:complete len:94 (-) Transcript_6890:78-359(-)